MRDQAGVSIAYATVFALFFGRNDIPFELIWEARRVERARI
ncbi:MAG: hypothetical protein ABR566_10305 [Pyrinomonadaceae bacterium]